VRNGIRGFQPSIRFALKPVQTKNGICGWFVLVFFFNRKMPSPQSVCLGGVWGCGGTMYAVHFLLAVSASTVSGALASIHQGANKNLFVCYLLFLHIHVPESLTKGTSMQYSSFR
jgi:hypothetical protein